MHKTRIFIDFPISDSKEFQGLSFPQVLHDYLVTRDDVELVGEHDQFDVILILNGGSHFISKAEKAKTLLAAQLNRLFKRKIDYDRFLKRNIPYEKRIDGLLAKNPGAKVALRLDDRYKMLCKVYGFDKTVKKFIKQADIVIFQSEYCKSLFTKGVHSIFGFEKPVNVKRSVVIHNGVDTEVFSPQGGRVDLDGKYKILHVAATGMVRKGLGKVLEYAHLLKDNPQIQFFLVGKQAEDPIYGADINKFGNVHQLEFTTDRYQLAQYYRSCDLLLFPSINDCAPNVVLEAMSCGLPVLAADSGGTPEMIIKEDLKGGLLINDQNPIYPLKEILENIMDFKTNALRLIDQYHKKEVIGQQYFDALQSIVYEKNN
ncbi:MAG: glycosyltransferase family 4 protein [Patescibacteria group bacterium]